MDENASSHSDDFVVNGKTERGHEAVLHASKIIAGTVFDLITSETLIKDIKLEFKEQKSKMASY
ncbi:hypothetical protein [Fusibacter sp. 3D3]|uniref:hypothetical protein n=1 Tax=Fusibacter sp. 3D3 TaxID=1048380 RepID=UPI000853B86F|nr:hypothetical protein [Fusibacter sp. 3D3]